MAASGKSSILQGARVRGNSARMLARTLCDRRHTRTGAGRRWSRGGNGVAGGHSVSNIDGKEPCPICLSGRFVKRLEEVDFLQWTDKGPVRCQVTILVAACEQCDYKTWGSEAEALMQAAVQKKYDELT